MVRMVYCKYLEKVQAALESESTGGTVSNSGKPELLSVISVKVSRRWFSHTTFDAAKKDSSVDPSASKLDFTKLRLFRKPFSHARKYL